MKTIIAGCRDIHNFDYVREAIGEAPWRITEVVSGLCEGVDYLGEYWALLNGIPVKPFLADLRKYGKRAGPIRNGWMADYSDALIAVWDGESAGTKDMIDRANAAGLTVYIYLAEPREK